MPNYFFFNDSIGQRHKIEYVANSYNNVMELILDMGLEDWGDCKGRAWCGTCHLITVKGEVFSKMDGEEKHRLDQLSNRKQKSRLACQIALDRHLHEMEFEFIGDD